jgi:uncharacterized membrane protein
MPVDDRFTIGPVPGGPPGRTPFDEEVDFEEESKFEKYKPYIKKYGPYVALAVVAIIVLYVIYLLVFTGIEEVTFTIVDTEGNPVVAYFKLKAPKKDKPIAEEAGKSSYGPYTLRHGIYLVTVTTPGYKFVDETIKIDEDTTNIKIVLEKDLGLEITEVEFPKVLSVGQYAEGYVIIKNRSYDTTNADLVLEGALKDLDIELEPKAISIPGTESIKVMMHINVPETLEVKDEKKGDTKTGSIRIKYLEKKATVKFKLFPMALLKYPKNIKFSGLDPARKREAIKTIKLTNMNNYDLENIRLSIQITSANQNDPEEVKNWFVFTTNGQNERVIERLESKSSKRNSIEEQIKISIPPTAKPELITGNIIIDSNSLPTPLYVHFTVEITRAVEAMLEIDLPPKAQIKIEQGLPEEKTVFIDIKNAGTVPVENVEVRVADRDVCNDKWLRFETKNTFGRIEVGEKRQITLTLTAPPSAPNKTTMRCRIEYTFTDAINGTVIQDMVDEVIEINVYRKD